MKKWIALAVALVALAWVMPASAEGRPVRRSHR